MAAHTKIVDLFGIPACGKTTLAKYLSENPPEGVSVATYRTAKEEMKKAPLYQYLLSLSLSDIVVGLRFCLYYKSHRHFGLNKIKNSLKNVIIRNYIRTFSKYDLVILDHGVAQTIVSWSMGDYQDEKSQYVVKNYLKTSKDSLFYFCDIPNNIAEQRILNRGRQIGHIDYVALNYPSKLSDEFNAERNRFKELVLLMNKWRYEISYLNMNKTQSEIASQLLKQIYP